MKIKDDLEKSMEEEMENAHGNQWRTEPCSIFRVPNFLRWSSFRSYDPKKIHNGPYDPKFVSIGPFHYGNTRLKPMEEFKLRALRFLLSKNGKKTTLHECLAKMKDLEPRARSCYAETFKSISNDDFAKMMLLDGCLVLLILNEQLEDIVLLPDRKIDADSKNDGAIAPAWPIFRSLLADLLLLENQVPFFVLDELFKLLLQSPNDEEKLASDDDDEEEEEEETLLNMALGTLIRAYPGKKYFFHFKYETEDETKIHHLLHLFYLAIALPIQRRRRASLGQTKGMPSLRELREAGVKCKPKNYAESFLDVTFHNGVIEIPTLILYPHTQTTLRNIIAFEQCFGAEDNKLTHISHYVIMMAFLIGGTTDISTLQDEEIIINWLGSQEEVLGVFKQLRTEVVDTAYDPFAELYDDVNSYRRLPLNKYREILRRDYFGNPWSICSVIAAVVLFVLTFMQTYFSVYTAYHPNS